MKTESHPPVELLSIRIEQLETYLLDLVPDCAERETIRRANNLRESIGSLKSTLETFALEGLPMSQISRNVVHLKFDSFCEFALAEARYFDLHAPLLAHLLRRMAVSTNSVSEVLLLHFLRERFTPAPLMPASCHKN